MKNLSLLFIALLLLQLTTPAQDFYPLEIGNKWDYEKTISEWGYPPEIDTFSVEVVGDSLFPNGQIYYVLNHWDLTGGRYVRADSDFVYYYDENDLEEDTLYRLNAQVGEEWFLQFGITTMIRLDSVTTAQIFSFSTTLLHYRLDGLILGFVTLSDKFGPVIFHSPGEPPGLVFIDIALIGCIIDSVEYGNPVLVEIDPTIPNEFTLHQNYPNPFNPTTKIRYSVPHSSNVVIKVFDILGNEIEMLVNEEKSIGSYEVEFYGTGIVSGIYFYRLQAGSFVETKKMILLK